MKLTETELQELAIQLSHPKGETGIQIGEMMNFTNEHLIKKTIDLLAVTDNTRVLEVGPGNGSHVNVITQNKTVVYYGIDVSETMVIEAKKLNKDFKNAFFLLSDGETIPFEDNFFTTAFTTNTIYFWKNPQDYTNEIARVLKPSGIFSIGFIPKSTMVKIPFAKYGFTMYEPGEITRILQKAGFEINNIYEDTELVLSNNGEQIEREIAIITAVLK